MESNPCSKIKKFKEPEGRTRYYLMNREEDFLMLVLTLKTRVWYLLLNKQFLVVSEKMKFLRLGLGK